MTNTKSVELPFKVHLWDNVNNPRKTPAGIEAGFYTIVGTLGGLPAQIQVPFFGKESGLFIGKKLKELGTTYGGVTQPEPEPAECSAPCVNEEECDDYCHKRAETS